MGFSLRSITEGDQVPKGNDSLNIYSPTAFSRRWAGGGDYLAATEENAAEGIDGAVRFLMARLFTSKEERSLFPRALTEGHQGRYARHLVATLSPAGARNLVSAFQSAPGTAVLDSFVKRTDLHEYFPAALIPGAQKRFVRWLFDRGRSEEGFGEGEILGFLRLCAENPSQMIATNYLLQPQWQVRFPKALESGQGQPFLEWVDEQFKPVAVSPFRQGEFPPAVATGIESTVSPEGLADRAPFSWRPVRKGLWERCFGRTRSHQGVNILGPFCFSGGVGQAARTTALALRSVGVPVSSRDIPGAPTATPRCGYLGPERYPITLIHALPDDPVGTLYRHVGWPLTRGKRRIGIWYWELEDLPESWAGNEEGLHEVWAPTEFIANTVRRHFSLPVVKMLPAVPFPSPGKWSRRNLGFPEQRFVFLHMFDMASTFERKNPLAVIEAFRLAGMRDAALVIKVSRGEFDPASSALLKQEADKCGALVLDEVMPREKANALIAHCDCYVSLHRSEGFGLPLAEAMLLGKPVIGTRYSGNLDFMNDGNSLLVDGGRVAVGARVRIYPEGSLWADPSVEQAAAHMRRVAEDRTGTRAMAEQGRRECAELLTPLAYGKRMRQRITQLWDEPMGGSPGGGSPRIR